MEQKAFTGCSIKVPGPIKSLVQADASVVSLCAKKIETQTNSGIFT